jgi:SAM-dependent methyltransferase
MGGEQDVTEPQEIARERLTRADIATGDLLAASHLHRYEFAAGACAGLRVLDLCCGTGYGAAALLEYAASVHGVDIDARAIDEAKEGAAAAGLDATFEVGDALEFLRSQAADPFEAVVCFEGIEHVPDPDAVLTELARLGEGGARLLLSFPNSAGFDEDNEFHVTDYGWEQVRDVAGRFEDGRLLVQQLAEGSVIRDPDASPESAPARLFLEDDADAWANHWLLAVGVPSDELERNLVRMGLAAMPYQNRYMRHLERANAELHRTNVALSRRYLGIHDAAAAVVLRRHQEAIQALERRAEEAEAQRDTWHEIADRNDLARRVLERRFATPRHRIADLIHNAILALPGMGVAKRAWRRLERRRG